MADYILHAENAKRNTVVNVSCKVHPSLLAVAFARDNGYTTVTVFDKDTGKVLAEHTR